MNGKKISVHTAGAAFAVLIVWGINTFARAKGLAYMEISAEVAVGFGTVGSILASIIFPEERTVE
jgi:hypothetical protein